MKIVAEIEVLPSGELLAWFYDVDSSGQYIGPSDVPRDWADPIDIAFLESKGVEIRFNNSTKEKTL